MCESLYYYVVGPQGTLTCIMSHGGRCRRLRSPQPVEILEEEKTSVRDRDHHHPASVNRTLSDFVWYGASGF